MKWARHAMLHHLNKLHSAEAIVLGCDIFLYESLAMHICSLSCIRLMLFWGSFLCSISLMINLCNIYEKGCKRPKTMHEKHLAGRLYSNVWNNKTFYSETAHLDSGILEHKHKHDDIFQKALKKHYMKINILLVLIACQGFN